MLLCEKTAERIMMLFGVNTFGGPWNIVLHGSPDPPTERRGEVGENFANYRPTAMLISGTAEAIERLEILHVYKGVVALTKTMQK